MKQSVCAVICAAGKGSRAGFSKNKLLTPLGESTVLQTTLSAFDFPAIDEIIVTSSKEDFAEISSLCRPFARTKVVLGGDTRSQSVYSALKAATAEIVLIHDGARPFVTREIIEGCIQSVKTVGSGICAVECRDTVACVKEGKILSVPSREGLRLIQTPQGFFRENILYAYERAEESEKVGYTDDSSVFADYCGAPRLCKGSPDNIKLTYAEDFPQKLRCGYGIDTHAFGKEQDYILLAGVKIPSESGLIAHSDGDVLIHAVMDALLSAAGLKDIGYYFPDKDEKRKNANSADMLREVLALLKKEGLRPYNLSVSIQAEKPRLAAYIDSMKNSLSGILKIDPTRIGVAAGTNEGLGYVGEGKGITVHTYALLEEEHYGKE